MKVAIITGSSGLIGSEAVRFFSSKGFHILGIDNNMRAYFFGESAGTEWNTTLLKEEINKFIHYNIDIRNFAALEEIFIKYNTEIELVIHTAAQPSHDWASKEPLTDFTINANGTLNLLELTRMHCPKAVFIFTSTNKVYGDKPNDLPLIELDKRWEIDPAKKEYLNGIDEHMSIDQSKHSLFGASKVAADILVQEYGRYFDLNTVVFRGGCLTGPAHSGAELHGFLSYIIKCTVQKTDYTIYGYKGKQVRDNIHSSDLVNAFWHFYISPRKGEVYNIGGSRFSNISILEAIDLIEELSGNKLNYTISDKNRSGDHIWYITDISKFCSHYPEWQLTFNMKDIIGQILSTF